MEVGFDSAPLQAGNGYVIDQFLCDSTNHRDDDHGNSPENRVRFLGETVARACEEIGAGRVGVRLSPNGDTQGCDDSDPASVFGAAARLIDAPGVAFVELRELSPDGTFGASEVPDCRR